MSEKDYQNLLELAKKELSDEEEFRLLVKCGLLNEEGYLIIPALHPYLVSKSAPDPDSRQ